MKDRLDLWAGDFGDQYHERNKPSERDVAARMFFWEMIAQHLRTGSRGRISSVLEIGAGTGLNLGCIHHKFLQRPVLKALEPNKAACERMLRAPMPIEIVFDAVPADFVFTYGVLIHLPQHGLHDMMRNIYLAANKYILAAEYFAPEEEVVPYRGKAQALWRRDYGRLYMDNFPDLKFLGYGFCWKPVSGLDNVTWWLFEKPARK
jgi:pseudaminic acid biosynthesis-associated methylase